jgi:hypothetical protein
MGKHKYINMEEIFYTSDRYNKFVYVPMGYPSDGATGALDIDSKSWWVHDVLCDTGVFFDGTPCTNWQASCILGDILRSERRWARAVYWKWLTFAFGGGKARDNGMFELEGK